MANNELLEATMAWIEEHPDQHNQGDWAVERDCGTTYCFAGAAVTLAGGEIEWEEGNIVASTVILGGERRFIETAAWQVLGLTWDQKFYLFFEASTIADLRKAVDAIKANPDWDPDVEEDGEDD